MRVLVTEDDEVLATAVAAGLRREGMAVDVALDGDAALERLTVNRYDVVVLDRDLPGVHGDDVCRSLGLHVQADIKPAALYGDPLLVQQLAANLIDNAVRHNIPDGDIHISTGTSEGRAVLSVANSGLVIPAPEVERLFQPFQRLGPRRSRRDGGHGLGLSIARAIVTAHAAAIAAQPRPGGGLAIDVAFPPPPQEEQAGRTTAR
jgi:signal transduction histidine kinase